MLKYFLMNAWRFPIIKRAWVLPKMSADSFVRDINDNRPIVLCCGDSITHGHIGYDWVGALRENDSSKIYVNAGVNGDLAWNLNQRLEDALKCNRDYFITFFREVLSRGIYLAPSPFESLFLSSSHSEADLDQTIEAFQHGLAAI